MMRRFHIQVLSRSTMAAIAATSLLLGACSPSQVTEQTDGGQPTDEAVASDAAEGPKTLVYVTNYPLQYFVERIGGEQVQVELPLPENIDPAFWEPTGDELAQLQGADLIILNGATYEKWLQTASLPQAKVVDTSQPFQDRWLSIQSSIIHQHGPEGEHSHEGTAFTTWVDPTLAIEQAAAIRDRLNTEMPDQADIFASNFKSLEQDLRAIDEQIATLVEASEQPQQPLLASHPVYDYLAERYDLNLKSALWEPDTLPDTAQWSELEEMLATHPAKWMIWEGEPISESVERLQELGVESVVFDPVGNRPETGDFLTLMQANVNSLSSVFAE